MKVSCRESSSLSRRRSAPLLRRVDRFAPECVISVVVYGELCFGLAASARRTEVSAHLAALVEMFPVLSLPLEAAGEYGSVRAALERKGRPIGQNDLWVAAHALADLTLVTNNEREFRRVPKLRVENWTR